MTAPLPRRRGLPRLALAALLLVAAPAAAQRVHDPADGHDHRLCGTPEPTTAEVLASVQAAEAWLAANADRLDAVRPGALVHIPVAMHIIQSGETVAQGNVPDAHIADQIAVMNTAFEPMGYRFFLAFQQRVVNPTWFTGMTNGTAAERAMKTALALDPARYLNFYTLRAGGSLLGWASLPGLGQETNRQQGVVVLDRSLPGGTAAPYNLGATGTHEVGHFVGLFHTFQGGCGGGTTGGDGVADTPEVANAFSGNAGCPTGIDSCPDDGLGPDLVENFMDYTDDACMTDFTAGQAERALGLMNSFRPTMMTQTGLIASATSLPFGDVPVGTRAERAVWIANLDGAPAQITGVSSSNPAFVPQVTAGTVAGTAGFEIRIGVTPAATGAQTGTLTVATDRPGAPPFSVALSATGVLLPVAAVAQPALAARAALGETAEAVLTLANVGPGALTFAVDPGAASPVLTSVAPLSGTVDPGAQQNVTFGLAGAGETASVFQRLVTLTTNDAALPELRVHLVVAIGDTLAPPALAAPRYSAQDVPRNGALEWLPVPEAAQYEVQVAFSQSFPTSTTQTQAVAEASATFSLAASRIHFWRVRSLRADGTASAWSLPFTFRTGTLVADDAAPIRLAPTALGTPFPNPARGSLAIPLSFAEPQAAISVSVLDVTGREVLVVAESVPLAAGTHRLEVDTRSLPAGVYVVRLRAGDRMESARVVVLR